MHSDSVVTRIRRSKWASMALKLALSVLAFWLALRGMDFSHLAALVDNQAHGLIIAVVILFFCQILFGAMRWRLILLALADRGQHVMRGLEVLNLYYISVFFNCCLPGTVGGDVVRVWLAKSDHVPLALSINSVVIDRVMALAALGVLAIATLPLLGEAAGFDATIVLPLVLLAIPLGIWFFRHIEKLLAPYRSFKPVHWLLYFTGCLRLLLKHKRAFLGSLSYAVVSHLIYCSAGYVLAISLGIPLTFAQCVTFLPLVMLATTIPISIGGWGVREASMVGLLGLVGVSSAQALTLSVELGLITMLSSLPAGVLWLVLRRRAQQPAAA